MHHLRIHHDEHRLTMDLSLIRRVPDIIRQENFNVTATILRPVREDGKNEIINIEPGDTTDRNFAIAVDIGTTTVFGQVMDLHTGEVLAQQGEFNAQISYGEDVISRIMYAEKGDGLATLHKRVVETINKIVQGIIKKAKIDTHEVSTITMAGNSTMTQLLLNINPSYIRRDPYVPASILYPPFHATEIGLELAEHTTALVYPGVSSYVGGDIISGIMASGMYRSPELTLYMDIGTNAEIAIGHQDWIMCTAASAGPAFEGGGVKFGMRAAKGAVEDVSINPVTYEPMIITVGNEKAKGICGSGLITLAARLLETGIIDSRGKFNQELDTPRIRQTDEIWEYVLVYEKDTQIERDITITGPGQPDPGQGRHVFRSPDPAGRDRSQGERHRTDHSGRRVRILCGPGVRHHHRASAGDRAGESHLPGQRVTSGMPHQLPDQFPAPAGDPGGEHDDQF
jgi:uncharacterized 2Fe-2S/4Fe-4S cluster protein (DUF4445 family)